MPESSPPVPEGSPPVPLSGPQRGSFPRRPPPAPRPAVGSPPRPLSPQRLHPAPEPPWVPPAPRDTAPAPQEEGAAKGPPSQPYARQGRSTENSSSTPRSRQTKLARGRPPPPHEPPPSLPALTRPNFPKPSQKNPPPPNAQSRANGRAAGPGGPHGSAPAAGRIGAAAGRCHSPSRASALSLRSRAATSSLSHNCHLPPERRGKERSGEEKLRRRRLPRGLGGHSAGGRRGRACAVRGGAGRRRRQLRWQPVWRREEDLLKIAARLGSAGGDGGGRPPGCAALPAAAAGGRAAPRGAWPGRGTGRVPGTKPKGLRGFPGRAGSGSAAVAPVHGPPAWAQPLRSASGLCGGRQPPERGPARRPEGVRRRPGKAGPACRPRRDGPKPRGGFTASPRGLAGGGAGALLGAPCHPLCR